MVLVFIGAKMLLLDLVTIPVGISLAVVAACIGVSVWLSLARERAGRPREAAGAG